jgi:Xaa-Pro aminopeptidase
MITEIPKSEFQDRVKRIQKELAARQLDALLTFGSEAEPQFVRYLSDYWPAFETASVLVPAQGDPILIIGPECLTYAQGRSKIDKIRQILEYRESSEPEYPGVKLDTFRSVFDEASGGKGVKRLGIAGYTVVNLPVYMAMRDAMSKGEVVRADGILINMRMAKSANELELMRQAFRMAEKAVEAVLNNIKPGMREVEVVGIAQEAIYRHGAEYEGHPMYVLSGRNSTNAIGRASQRRIGVGEVIQLDIGARFAGYASSVGRPICLEMGLDAENKTIEILHAGIEARDVALQIADYITQRGYAHAMLYGPCHGIGLMECEHPWVETSSNYKMAENLTYQVDSFLAVKDFGCRWEDGVCITRDGVEQFSTYRRELIII